uniref:Uncharacterized protein n=1 Tax=Tanacetum cinerariifolium TaxID=118510 RepID=A0A699JL83_TANCI|nr:hypothetical protein [Tanacetum cinerariifolium]
MRDFHKTHPSRSDTITKTALSVSKIKPFVTSKGTGVKPGVPNVAEEESSKSKAESLGNDEDNNNKEQDSSDEDSDQEKDSDDDKTQSDNKNELDSKSDQEENKEEIEDDEEEEEDEFVRAPSNDSDKGETKITDTAEGDEDEEIDYITSQLYDDMDIRLNELVDTDKGFVQEEATDAAMTNVQQGNENPEILQVIEDSHVTLSTVPQKTEVPVTSSFHSSNLAAKFLNFLDIPHTDVEIVSLMDVHVHHEVPSQQTPTLLTIYVLVISDSSPVFSTVILQSLPTFTPPPQQSTSTPTPTTKATNPESALLNFTSVFQFNNIITTLEKEVAELKKDPLHTQEVSNSPLVIQNIVKESLEDTVLAKESSQPQSSYEAAAMLTEFELKKRSQKDKDKDCSTGSDRGLKKKKTSNDAEPTKGLKAEQSQSGSSKGDKSQSKSFRKYV